MCKTFYLFVAVFIFIGCSTTENRQPTKTLENNSSQSISYPTKSESVSFPSKEEWRELTLKSKQTVTVLHDISDFGQDVNITKEEALALIKQKISPKTWNDKTYTIHLRHSTLIVQHNEQTHGKIKNLLTKLRQEYAKPL